MKLENVISKVREHAYRPTLDRVFVFHAHPRVENRRVLRRDFAVVSKLKPASHFVLVVFRCIFVLPFLRFPRAIVILVRWELEAVRVAVFQIHPSEQFARHGGNSFF